VTFRRNAAGTQLTSPTASAVGLRRLVLAMTGQRMGLIRMKIAQRTRAASGSRASLRAVNSSRVEMSEAGVGHA
jgi:hypothetical protein